MLRIFVAGGTGVLGRRVIPELLASGFRVTASSRSEKARAALKTLGAEPVTMDLFDAADVKRAVGEQDVVINLATHVPPSTARALLPGAWRENDRIRTVGAANLAAAAKAGGADAVIQESFAPIYEDGGDRWIDETWPVRPARYNKSTLEAERAATMFTRRGGRGVILPAHQGLDVRQRKPQALQLDDPAHAHQRSIRPRPRAWGNVTLPARSHGPASVWRMTPYTTASPSSSARNAFDRTLLDRAAHPASMSSDEAVDSGANTSRRIRSM